MIESNIMIKILKLELLYFSAIVVILAFLQHPDLFVSPLTRFNQMSNAQNYFHPLLWAFGLYLLIAVFRGLFRVMNNLKDSSY